MPASRRRTSRFRRGVYIVLSLALLGLLALVGFGLVTQHASSASGSPSTGASAPAQPQTAPLEGVGPTQCVPGVTILDTLRKEAANGNTLFAGEDFKPSYDPAEILVLGDHWLSWIESHESTACVKAMAKRANVSVVALPDYLRSKATLKGLSHPVKVQFANGAVVYLPTNELVWYVGNTPVFRYSDGSSLYPVGSRAPPASACSTSWPMTTTTPANGSWVRNGVKAIQDAKTPADARKAASAWLDKVRANSGTLAGAAQYLLHENVAPSALVTSKGCATPAAQQIYWQLQGAIRLSAVVTSTAPANGYNSGTANGVVVASVRSGISGNLKAIKITLPDGKVIWVMARCGNAVTQGPPPVSTTPPPGSHQPPPGHHKPPKKCTGSKCHTPPPPKGCKATHTCPPPPPHKCPPGTTGTPGHCHKPPPPKCPKGTTGTPPHCKTPPPPHCKYGGTYPNCKPKPPCHTCVTTTQVQQPVQDNSLVTASGVDIGPTKGVITDSSGKAVPPTNNVAPVNNRGDTSTGTSASQAPAPTVSGSNSGSPTGNGTPSGSLTTSSGTTVNPGSGNGNGQVTNENGGNNGVSSSGQPTGTGTVSNPFG
jgi:hypothetical protein